ncbi:MAG TPA: lamin tail domain-containing protein, partial [Kofleriaceae bacterium]
MVRWAVVVMAFAACDSGSAPELQVDDQIAAVGIELVVDLEGTDPDGDALSYGVDGDIELVGATITRSPRGVGVFRWTPIATDVGEHVFDFTASDGSNTTTVSVNVDVRSAIGAVPIFREPLGAGTVLDLIVSPCVTLAIVIEDQDTPQVTLAQEEPVIEGGMLFQSDGTTGTWEWCPTPAQAAAERHTLVLSADDGENPKTIKNYILVVRDGAAGPHLVINETDYDQVNTDNKEYVELYNPGATALDVGGLQVVLVNGANKELYATIDLSPVGSLASGEYLVIAGPSVSVPPSATKLDPVWTSDEIQNGAPDGIALIDSVGRVVLDALSYEGAINDVTFPGFATPVSLVEGTALD